MKNRAPLRPAVFYELPLTSVKPSGWLRRQLEIQAEGLSGHLDEFWPDVGPESAWLGGRGEAWERGPYYLDGLVPLAYLLDSPVLRAKAERWVRWTLENQRADGYIGPAANNGWWPRMIMLKVLAQYYEATGDARVPALMQRYFSYQLKTLPKQPLEKWAKHRWGDELLTVLWLYNRTGNPQLLQLAKALREQGFDWKEHFQSFQYTGKIAKDQANQDTHVVNNAMSLKTFTLWSLVSKQDDDSNSLRRQLEVMDRYHLLPSGVHSGDEHYAGNDPSQGTELCAVVEGMFSIEQAIAVLGDSALGDRLEKMAYNPLPGTFSGDMWSHQYDQQPNQVLCDLSPRAWTTNGNESNLFGLEPNFGCCTSNLHQGWPKFVAHLWMATPDDGIAAIAYGPSEVTTYVRNRVRAVIREETEYPFQGSIRLTVAPDRPAAFPLLLRIPLWAEGAVVKVNGKEDKPAQPGDFLRIERTWTKGDKVDLEFPLRLRISRWYHNSVAVERGPLVFSLKIGEDWRKIRDKAPAADWEVHPTTAWNYGLRLDPKNPGEGVKVVSHPMSRFPFSLDEAPVELVIQGRRIAEWDLVNASAGPVPNSPARSTSPLEPVTLIPYGAAKLRITAFPLLEN